MLGFIGGADLFPGSGMLGFALLTPTYGFFVVSFINDDKELS